MAKRVRSASFSPDGKRVVTASSDKTARVWDADTGKPVGEPMTHGEAVLSASFSPDGKRVVTASEDKTARVWNVFWSSLVRAENLIEEVCQRKLRGNVRMDHRGGCARGQDSFPRTGRRGCLRRRGDSADSVSPRTIDQTR